MGKLIKIPQNNFRSFLLMATLMLVFFTGLLGGAENAWGQNTLGPGQNGSVAPTNVLSPGQNAPLPRLDPSTTPSSTTPVDFEKELGCYLMYPSTYFTGCVLRIFYLFIVQIPSALLWVASYFFNILVHLVMKSSMYDDPFIEGAWKVVRDLSNIFFILILLYIAIKTVLGMGGHETKKVIASVVMMALLINFSLFFSKIIIDSSNVLALIFYNKLDTNYRNSAGAVATRPYPYAGKDVTGAMYEKFNATKLLNQEFINQLKTVSVISIPAPTATEGAVKTVAWGLFAANPFAAPITVPVTLISTFLTSSSSSGLPTGPTVMIMIVAGAIMLYAAYVFIASGIYFIGRFIELWILMIFSPFAFMSYALPQLAHVEYVGWDSWSKKLVSASFSAPIFMFFLYLIFKLLESNIFKSFAGGGGVIGGIIGVILPALLILGLLSKAKAFAKKAGGQFGEMVTKVVSAGGKLAGVAGVVAVGAATGGTALAGRATLGAFMKGASTGDTAANRMIGSAGRIATHEATIARPGATVVEKTEARKAIFREKKDKFIGAIQEKLGVDKAQKWVGERLNQDQHNIEHAKHARHDLDEAAGKVAPGKKWDDLNGEQRYQVRRQIARDKVVRDNSGATVAPAGNASHVPGLLTGLGTRKWDALTTAEQALIDAADAVGNNPATGHATAGGALEQGRTVADKKISDARSKQGIISSVVQSTVTGTYDPRNLANMVAKEQSTGIAKMATVLTSVFAMGMRGGFRTMGIKIGNAEGKFLKDLGSTITEALKNVKVSVDLSHVGEEKKEDHKGGGGGGHH